MLPHFCRAFGLFLYVSASFVLAQETPKPDVLIFVDGETLIGELQSATDHAVVFKSNMGFAVTVPWAKVRELTSAKKFAVIHKDQTLRGRDDLAKVPQGPVQMTNQSIDVQAAPPQTIPVKEVSNVVNEGSFERAFRRRHLWSGWKGAGSFGVALTESTVTQNSFTSGISLERTTPSESWTIPRDRSTVTFNSSYDKTKAGQFESNITIFHSDLLHDHYLTPRWFAFLGATFDHNSAQGLNLLQGYGGGIGNVVFKTDKTEIDARAGIGYLRQTYDDPALNRNLIGSRFNETITHTFPKGIVLFEMAGVRPSWNDLDNTFAGFVVNLTVPVYHGFGVTLGSFDSYVNNPPPGFKKNTFQLSVGLSYAIK